MARSLLLILSLAALLGPGCLVRRETPAKAWAIDHLKQIASGAGAYEKVQGYPCHETRLVGKSGLSWRAELLPFVEHDSLYKELKKQSGDFTRPLFTPEGTRTPDADRLSAYLDTRLRTYTLPNRKDRPGTTVFRRVARADKPRAFVVVETSDPVPWAEGGDDLVLHDGKPLPKMGGNFKDGFLALCADGKVRWVPSSLSEEKTIAALFDGVGGEVQ